MTKNIYKSKIKIKWSSNFAYAIGLIVSDGCLSKNVGHISFTSKDIEQIKNFKKALRLNTSIGLIKSGYDKGIAYRVQFRDSNFYVFLNSIGILSKKSLTIGAIKIPDKFFFDFLRGEFDGDGCTYSYKDKRWKYSFMFYLCLASGSKTFLEWLHFEIRKRISCTGSITSHFQKGGKRPFYQLRFAKNDSVRLVRKMYGNDGLIHLSRKKLKINVALGIMGLSHV